MNKLNQILVAAVSSSSLFLNSCAYYYGDVPVYGGSNVAVSSAWTAASYDASGFPIYGYYRGRPVYGYTAEGVAIFTLAALTALCFVPDWGPAPWYHGSWHYPPRIHHGEPPHHPHNHYPHSRPRGGMHAPIHTHPASVLHNGGHNGRPANHRHNNNLHGAPDRNHSLPMITNNHHRPNAQPMNANNHHRPNAQPGRDNNGANNSRHEPRPNTSGNRSVMPRHHGHGPTIKPNSGASNVGADRAVHHSFGGSDRGAARAGGMHRTRGGEHRAHGSRHR